MIYYKKYQNKNEESKAYGKWYARAVNNGTVDLEGLAEHMSEHNTPYSKGAIAGVLTDMVSCIRELVLEGKAVKLPNLAIFQIGLTTIGANTPEDFNIKKNVKYIRLRTRATGNFSNAVIKRIGSLREYDEYDKPQTEQETPELNP